MKVRTSTRYELEKAVMMGDAAGFKSKLAERLASEIGKLDDEELQRVFRKAAENSTVDWDRHYEEVYDDGVAVSHQSLRVQSAVIDQFALDIMDFIKTRYRAAFCRPYTGDS